jgi:hypothetical protein
MWKSFFSVCLLFAIFGGGFVYVLPQIAPDYSRQGTKVLINGIDTAIITQEEKPKPKWITDRGWVGRKREVSVRYKDNMGIYHEESFPENEITELETNP